MFSAQLLSELLTNHQLMTKRIITIFIKVLRRGVFADVIKEVIIGTSNDDVGDYGSY
jgi:hypothetical protein